MSQTEWMKIFVLFFLKIFNLVWEHWRECIYLQWIANTIPISRYALSHPIFRLKYDVLGLWYSHTFRYLCQFYSAVSQNIIDFIHNFQAVTIFVRQLRASSLKLVFPLFNLFTQRQMVAYNGQSSPRIFSLSLWISAADKLLKAQYFIFSALNNVRSPLLVTNIITKTERRKHMKIYSSYTLTLQSKY